MKVWWMIAALPGLAASAATLAAGLLPSAIPLEKGTKWVYEGKVSGTPVQGTPTALAGSKRTNEGSVVWTALKPSGIVYHATVRWVTEVVENIESNHLRAAVVRGYPDELAWAEFGQEPGYCVLAAASNRVYRLGATNQTDARRLAHEFVATAGRIPDSAYVIFELPLAVNRRWDGDTERPDGWYCWRVEKRTERQFRIKGVLSRRATEVFTIAYRTNPDHQLVEMAQVIGIVRYVYEHHGTVASADVRLVEFSRP